MPVRLLYILVRYRVQVIDVVVLLDELLEVDGEVDHDAVGRVEHHRVHLT